MRRLQLAAATRILVHAGVLGYSGHLSERIPGTDRFLIQPVTTPRVGLQPEDLLECTIDAPPKAAPIEVYIHSEIYRARPDVGAVAHFHHDPATLLTVVADLEFLPLKNHAYRWHDGVPVHPDSSHIKTPAQGRAVAATLGGRSGLNLRCHGQVLVAEDTVRLIADTIHFVENVAVLLRAYELGVPVPLRDEELRAFGDGFDRARHARKLWDYYVTTAIHEKAIPDDWGGELFFDAAPAAPRARAL